MEKSPFIGQMDRKITVVEKVISRSTTGAETFTDNTICEPYACLNEMGGSEDVEGKVIHLINRSYTIRYRAEVKATANQLIVIDDGKRYEIYHAKEIGRQKHIELLVRNHE